MLKMPVHRNGRCGLTVLSAALALGAASWSACADGDAPHGEGASRVDSVTSAVAGPGTSSLLPRWELIERLTRTPSPARMSSLAGVVQGGAVAVFWTATDGSIRRSRMAGGTWDEIEVAAPGSALPWGGLAAVASGSRTELFWIGPRGSVEDARWLAATAPVEIIEVAPPGSAATTSHLAPVLRSSSALDLFWIGADGSVQNGYWCASESRWCRASEVAGPAGASTFGRIAAISPEEGHLTVAWIDVDGAVRAADRPFGMVEWSHSLVSPVGTASIRGSLGAASPEWSAVALTWTGPDGRVLHARGDGASWSREQVAGPGSAAASGRITSVVREPGAMELFWIGPDGSVTRGERSAGGWSTGVLAGAEAAPPASGLAAVSSARDRLDVWWIHYDRIDLRERRGTWLAEANWVEGRP
jgi:hypothetical protein